MTHGVISPVSVRSLNLSELLTQTARRYPTRPALVQGARVMDWKTLDARASALAHALSVQGIGAGDRVLLHSPNCFEFVETMLAVWRMGAIWVPTNFRLTPDEVAYLAKSSGAAALIVHADYPQHLRSVAAETSLKATLVIGGDYDVEVAPFVGQPFPAAQVNRDDPAWCFFTSGTTGRPKAGVLTHGQLAFVTNNHLADLMPGMTAEHDASLVVAPLSHGAGVHFLPQLARGVVSVLPEGPGLAADQVWRLVAQHHITNMFTVPTILNRLTSDPSVNAHDHSSLRCVIYAGAPMYRADQIQALEKLGKVLVQYFGLGEVTGNITVLPAHEHPLGRDPPEGICGYARPDIDIPMQSDRGEVLPPHSPGEICIAGGAVFAGYYNNPEANAKAFRNGWFLTGDLGYLDEEGYLYITGRASDMYISGGSNVYPREIVEAALMHPHVAEAAVIGVEDTEWGEAGLMAVVLSEELSEPALRAHLAERLARYKIPKQILFWDALPKSGYGKVTKALILDRLARDEEAG